MTNEDNCTACYNFETFPFLTLNFTAGTEPGQGLLCPNVRRGNEFREVPEWSKIPQVESHGTEGLGSEDHALLTVAYLALSLARHRLPLNLQFFFSFFQPTSSFPSSLLHLQTPHPVFSISFFLLFFNKAKASLQSDRSKVRAGFRNFLACFLISSVSVERWLC